MADRGDDGGDPREERAGEAELGEQGARDGGRGDEEVLAGDQEVSYFCAGEVAAGGYYAVDGVVGWWGAGLGWAVCGRKGGRWSLLGGRLYDGARMDNKSIQCYRDK